jgi:hypothetical protein
MRIEEQVSHFLNTYWPQELKTLNVVVVQGVTSNGEVNNIL